MYSEKERKQLLCLAREAIENPSQDFKTIWKEKSGVFVTLTEKEKLRGCIGYIEPFFSLSEAVVKAARSAAYSDYRFNAVKKGEMKDIKIEISVLSPIKEMKNKEDIKIGKDGLIIEYQGKSGLLLPQVAIEYKMSKREFLEALSQKAGLQKDAWKDKDFKIKKFQAEIFSE